MSRRVSIVAVLFALSIAVNWCSDAAAADTPPNIVLIVADDLGYGELGCQGATDIPTPNIDSIAKSGVRFTNGYVSCPVCSPTRAGLLTGRYQQRFGHEFNPGPANVAGDDFGLSRDEVALPERLKAAGYKTGMVGKWHLGYSEGSRPTERGFDEFFGFLGGAHPYVADGGQRRNLIMRGTESIDEPAYLTDAFEREAVAFIERHKADRFFLYLPFNAVHAPMQATDEDRGRFENVSNENRQIFSAMLVSMDDAIGAVLAKLREAKLEDNTLIFFVSDNGGPTQVTTSRNGTLRGRKGTTWEGGIRVPFLVQWKGHIPEGKTYDQPVIALDIHPTALAAAGVSTENEKPFDGVNLLPYLNGQSEGAPHDALYWRFGTQMAIRQGDWKITKGTDAPMRQRAGEKKKKKKKADAEILEMQLFNLANDVGETKNVASENPEKMKELTAAWEKWSAELAEPRWTGRRR